MHNPLAPNALILHKPQLFGEDKIAVVVDPVIGDKLRPHQVKLATLISICSLTKQFRLYFSESVFSFSTVLILSFFLKKNEYIQFEIKLYDLDCVMGLKGKGINGALLAGICKREVIVQ